MPSYRVDYLVRIGDSYHLHFHGFKAEEDRAALRAAKKHVDEIESGAEVKSCSLLTLVEERSVLVEIFGKPE